MTGRISCKKPSEAPFQKVGTKFSSFRQSSRDHYYLAQPFLWRCPILHVQNVKTFLNFVHKKPVLKPYIPGMAYVEKYWLCTTLRSSTVRHITLDFSSGSNDIEPSMFKFICELRASCIYATVEVYASTKLYERWVKDTLGIWDSRVKFIEWSDASQRLEMDAIPKDLAVDITALISSLSRRSTT